MNVAFPCFLFFSAFRSTCKVPDKYKMYVLKLRLVLKSPLHYISLTCHPLCMTLHVRFLVLSVIFALSGTRTILGP